MAALALAVALAGCGSTQGVSPPVPVAPTSQTTAEARCPTAQLQFSYGNSDAGTGNRRIRISVKNRGRRTCFLNGYPGVALVDARGTTMQNAKRSTQSFFGDYAPPHRVDIPAGGASSFDLSWAGIDPCADGVPQQVGAALKITPPDNFDSATLPGAFTTCPNTLVVHPLGSTVPGSH